MPSNDFLTPLLKQHVSLLREILSDYAIEENLLLQGEFHLIKEIHKRRFELRAQVRLIQEQIDKIDEEDCSNQLFKEQIKALETEMEDKIAFIKNLDYNHPKVEDE